MSQSKVDQILHALYWYGWVDGGYEDVTMEKVVAKAHEQLKALMQEIIGDDDKLRAKTDMLEAQYHRAKGRNELRADQRTRLEQYFEGKETEG